MIDTTKDYSLSRLRQLASGKSHLEAKLSELKGQRREYSWNMSSFRAAYQKEQEDLEKLEGKSLANYFYQVIGKLDDKLNEQRREAYAAKVKLDAAERELAGIESDIDQTRSQLSEARIAEVQYLQNLEKKKAQLRTSGTEDGENILKIEEKIANLEAQKREIKEAISAGHSARATADQILFKLKKANGWNTWDILGGDGIITHMVKHGHLDEAQELVTELQTKLRRFKTELADVHISAGLQVNVEGFLRFADYFFDGLFADWAMDSRINQSISSVTETRNQIVRTLEKLSAMESAADDKISRAAADLESIVIDA